MDWLKKEGTVEPKILTITGDEKCRTLFEEIYAYDLI